MKTIILGVALVLATVVASGVGVRAASRQGSEKPAQNPEVTLVGCLERDSPTSSAAAQTASDITAFRLAGVSADALRSAESAAGFEATSATAVRLRRYCDLDFLDHVGHTVKVSGRLVDEGLDARRLSVVTAQGTIGWTPVIRVESFDVGGACR
jgi:hypothetical protein